MMLRRLQSSMDAPSLGRSLLVASWLCLAGPGLAQPCEQGIWSQAASLGPGPRQGSAVAFDSARSRTVLFGGENLAGFQGDTWEFNGAAWVQAAAAGPTPRVAHAMTYDSARQRTVLFGGNGSGLRETWEWDGAGWSLRGTGGPPGRYGHAMAYDSLRQRTVLFGGRNAAGLVSTDVWEWDGAAWVMQPGAGPAARTGHAMAFDSVRARVMLLGGQVADMSYRIDLWEWDGAAWAQVAISGPSVRAGHAMCFDNARGCTVVFGGQNNAAGPLSDTWEFSGLVWTLRPAPGPRAGPGAMAFDSVRGAAVFYSASLVGNTARTWDWNLAEAPTIALHPASTSAAAGQQVFLTSSALGTGPLAYQWRRGGVNLTDGPRITGANASTLNILSAGAEDSGVYDVLVQNTCGSVASSTATLTVVSLCGTADFNGDGDVGTDLDIEAFFAALAGNVCATCWSADFDGDGDTGTDLDIEAFFRVLGGGSC